MEPILLRHGANSTMVLESHYLKPVVIVAPDIQFGEHILKSVACPSCKVIDKLASNGWVDSYRYVHGVKSGTPGSIESMHVLSVLIFYFC